MKTLCTFTLFLLFGFISPLSAQLPLYNSAENTLKKASDLETRQQPLRDDEHQLAEREQTVFGKFDALQHQQPPTTHVATVEAVKSRIKTTVNGIDRIDTTAVLPHNFSVEQLGAVKQIADTGVLIAQQRLGLEQYQLGSTGHISRMRVLKGVVLWGLLLSIPSLLTLSWIARNMLRAWRSSQQDRLAYQLKELESVERHIAITERPFDGHYQRE